MTRQLWRWFCQIDESRDQLRLTEPTTTMTGALAWKVTSRIMRAKPSEILAWFELTGTRPDHPWQVAALLLIDDFFVRTRNDPPAPQVKATGTALKAMFAAIGKRKKKK